ncbi:DUF2335 domain-containing protein [Sphingomonas sp. 2378]|uniref:DUF2335 domain-containing protein n=1 Tax=Sphingomonas sp. 2378 TaxID=1219748 RepID=UPI00311AD131
MSELGNSRANEALESTSESEAAPAVFDEAAEDASNPTVIAQPVILQPQGIPIGMQVVPGMQVAHVQQVQMWQGPYPPPDAIERYEATLPGAFDRILRMAERQQEATIEASQNARDLLQADTRRGHWLGTIVTMASIGGAIGCAALGHVSVALALVGVPVLSVAKSLIDSARAKPVVTPAPSAPTPAAQAEETEKKPEE